MRFSQLVQSAMMLFVMVLAGQASAQAPDADPSNECSRAAIEKMILDDGKKPENAEIFQLYLQACEQAKTEKSTRRVNRAIFSKLLLVRGCDQKAIRDNATLEGSKLLANGYEARSKLRRALCEWVSSPYAYEKLYSKDEQWGWSQNQLVDVQEIQNLVQDAERQGLNAAEQAFASFFEAVLHTLTAEYFLDRIQAADTAETSENTAARFKGNPIDIISYCRARTAAMGNLASIDYGSFDYLFTEAYSVANVPGSILTKPDDAFLSRFLALNSSLSDLLSKATTGNHALSEVRAVTCGDFAPVDRDLKQTLISNEVTEVTEDYLGATNPATAMFQQKVELMDKLKPEFITRLDKLSQQAGGVDRVYQAVYAHFDQFKTRLTTALTNYKEAYGIVYAVTDWFNRWQDGLTIPPGETVPVGYKLRNSLDTFNVELNGKPDATEASGLDMYRSRVQKLKSDLTEALNRPQVYKQGTLQLCRVYYCQIQQNAQAKLRLQNGCGSSVSYKDSPLCSKDKVYKVGSMALSLKELCTKAGLEEKFMAPTLVAADANACASKLVEETRNL